MNMFRTLRADEIDCRISQVKKDGSGLSLLLYKDARCDQNILDEIVGPFNWQRVHTRDNRNCIVSIKNPETGEWISKEDTGTESNTESEKGLASDSFKRACFNWGIGRELYTAPFIWIKKGDFSFENGKCFDRFTVSGIGYTDGVITGLEIINQKKGKVVYRYGEITEKAQERPEKPDDEPEKETPMQNAGTAPTARTAPKAEIKTGNTVPAPDEITPVKAFLLKELKGLREARNLSPKANNDLFKVQMQELIKAGFAPDKALDEYTLPEAETLIKNMYEKFTPKGTEIKA